MAANWRFMGIGAVSAQGAAVSSDNATCVLAREAKIHSSQNLQVECLARQ